MINSLISDFFGKWKVGKKISTSIFSKTVKEENMMKASLKQLWSQNGGFTWLDKALKDQQITF